MTKLIIFDWDDVFTLGSKEGYIRCLHESIDELGIKLDPKEEHARIIATWGKPHRQELTNLLRENPQLLDKACQLYEQKFFGGIFVKGLRLVEGSIELLNRLKEDYILGIATGAHPKILKEQVMPRFGIPQVFAQIMSGYEIDDPEKQKPHPYMLEEIMKVQKVSPEQTIFVGDAKTDVLMAQAAGVRPVVVLTGHLNREQALALKVSDIIPSVTQLETVLKN